MRPGIPVATAALLLWLVAPPATRPQSPEVGPLPRAAAAPPFSGRYRLGLAFGASCPVKGPAVSVEVQVLEAAVQTRVEVDGEPSDKEDAKVARLVLRRDGDHLHGAVAVKSNEEVLGILTLEGERVWMQLMADGTASTSGSGKVVASGQAFGDLQVSQPGDDSRDTLGSCTARDHTWSLEPF
jgi:hypothetical protein